ncbi:arginine N-succinyltransferase [Thermaurantiacus sp.]
MPDIRLSDWQVRPARESDLEALCALAELTGGGFTNLPCNRDALKARIERSLASLARKVVEAGDELYLLVLEHRPTGLVRGTAAVFGGIGISSPFYSYKITSISLHSRELSRTFRTRVLHLVNDFDGASEVGGLFLHPDVRTGGLGRLLARSRYMFIARHRERFADRCVAELRGVIRADGSSPFWDGLAGRFFGMDFVEADHFNSVHGNQFIADLMPKYPVYAALLPETAVEVMGVEHPDGRGARRMLEQEGFRFNAYIDIFDGGPTLDVETDRIRTLVEARSARAAPVPSCDGATALISMGQLADFRALACPALLEGERAIVPLAAGVPDQAELLHAPF